MFDLKSWLIGFALGLAGKPLPLGAGKEPIAYLYNGVQLPDIYNVYTPEVQAKYPKVHITHGTITWLWCESDELYVTADGKVARKTIHDVTIYIKYLSSITNTYIWTPHVSFTDTTTGPGVTVTDASDIIWANYDIYTEDGTLYLAASEPIPVYE